MRCVGRPSLIVGIAVLAATLVSCSASREIQAGRDLAASLKIASYRHVSTSENGAVTIDYFVGPPGVDLMSTATADGWKPEPPPADYPNARLLQVIAMGTVLSDSLDCKIVISRLTIGIKPFSTKNLSHSEISDIEAGRLWWLIAETFCAPMQTPSPY
jgi:hypothetical protein